MANANANAVPGLWITN